MSVLWRLVVGSWKLRAKSALSLHSMTLPGEVSSHPVAQVPLEFHAAVPDGTAAPAGTLQFLEELFEKSLVLRQAIDDGDGLAAAAGFFDAEFGDETRRDRSRGLVAARAFAVVDRPATGRAQPSARCRVDEPGASHRRLQWQRVHQPAEDEAGGEEAAEHAKPELDLGARLVAHDDRQHQRDKEREQRQQQEVIGHLRPIATSKASRITREFNRPATIMKQLPYS